MPRFRKRPVVIEAEQFDGTVDDATRIIRWMLSGGGYARYHEPGERIPGPGRGVTTLPAYLAIDTLEGTMRAEPGDWIIRGVQGEHYPCKPAIFEATYEEVQ